MLRLLHRCHLPIFSRWSNSLTHLRRIHETVVKPLAKTLSPLPPDFTVSFLAQHCGLSPGEALSVAKKFILKRTDTTANADSVISLLKSLGFTQNQIANSVIRYPHFLTFNPEKKIKPKLEFFLDHGYSRADLAKLISLNTPILSYSLEKSIRPNYDMLKGILGNDAKVAAAIGNCCNLLSIKKDKFLLPNLNTLKDLGVSGDRIVKFVTFYSRSLLKSHSRFNSKVDLLKKMGFDASKFSFLLGISVLSHQSKDTWNRKFQVYKGLGWSDENIFSAFRRHPFCMTLSDEKIKQNFCFFAEKLQWAPSYLAVRPYFLSFSFEKTILPRFKVFQILVSKRLKKKNPEFSSLLATSKARFYELYVLKYADQVPELLEAHKNDS